MKIGIHFNKILPSSFHPAVTRSFAEAVRRELYPPECREGVYVQVNKRAFSQWSWQSSGLCSC